METTAETTIFLLRPFFIALYIGLFFALVIFIREKAHQRKMKKEKGSSGEKLKAVRVENAFMLPTSDMGC